MPIEISFPAWPQAFGFDDTLRGALQTVISEMRTEWQWRHNFGQIHFLPSPKAGRVGVVHRWDVPAWNRSPFDTGPDETAMFEARQWYEAQVAEIKRRLAGYSGKRQQIKTYS